MPRLPEARPPAKPSSQGQKDRHSQMLRAAVKLGSQQDFERVQMQDVAAESEVAIATLYRYFPSKVHLFVGVMRAELEKVDPRDLQVDADQDLGAVVTDLLMLFTKEMYANRRLSMSMIQSIILSEGLDSPDSAVIEEAFLALLLRVAGWHRDPTEDQRRRCWLVIQCWFGVLVTTLSGNRPLESAEQDLRRACELLLAVAG
ncbi:TetR/AcrR family transcriptional regulator [Nocardioides marmorisolisilvae]|uniref:TetR/AcrR family transcriptional regulator n=1 Tax=Nocardioides marmorisolisilvae TaxID=1542737 RepID=A0A3N0DX80_9ACTN|nr:TetR/AcrR family transcriptional regulator [Nocardioides marmorisolisilvae]RNL80222.1 TetR/AcrR family transcriptional regulator [Nocardioides marmorisolisilvae]